MKNLAKRTLAILLALLMMMSGFALAEETVPTEIPEGTPLEDVTEPYELEEIDLPGAEENIAEQAAAENSLAEEAANRLLQEAVSYLDADGTKQSCNSYIVVENIQYFQFTHGWYNESWVAVLEADAKSQMFSHYTDCLLIVP